MSTNNRFALNQTAKQYMNYLFYLLFIIYMIYLIIHEAQVSLQITYLVMTVLLIAGVTLAEILKAWSVQAMQALTQNCDPETGLRILQKIQRCDLFKGYRQFALVFQALARLDLANHDLAQAQELLDWLDLVGEKRFSTSLDLRLVYMHSRFRANLLLDCKDQARDYYQATMNLRDKKILNKKITPLYAWDMIVAEYQAFNGNNKEARKSLAKVDTDRLNPREKANYDRLSYKICQ